MRYLTFFNLLDLANNLKGCTMKVSSIQTTDDFAALVAYVKERRDYVEPDAFAIGIGLEIDNKIVAVQYPVVNCRGENSGSAAILSAATDRAGEQGGIRLTQLMIDYAETAFAPFMGDGKDHPNISALRLARRATHITGLDAAQPVPVVTFINNLQEEAVDTADVYLRFALLSHRKVEPNTINLDGIFGKLETLAWTSEGVFLPVEVEWEQAESLATSGRPVQVYCLDKFPPMLSMCAPEGVRIADGQRVRLGAHLAEGTTVMHEGFCNFNAGTLGASMVEGRISAGVVVGDGSDIGGGASIMGTLSGGGKEVISVGEGCLIGANAGIGISLGDNCTVEAGLYVTAGTLVALPDGRLAKASQLSGRDNLLFRRNSVSGQVEVLPNGDATWGGLNAALHSN